MRSGGSGTSNDGNTARASFQNTALSANITGIKEALLGICGTISQALLSGFKLDAEAFEKYLRETARKFVTEYE